MRIKLKKVNIKRLASLSALGAGALGVAGTAEASSIIYSGIIDEHVGFLPGFQQSASFQGPNGAGGLLERVFSQSTGGSTHFVKLRAKEGAYGTGLRFLAQKVAQSLFTFDTFARAFPAGAEWGTAATAALAPPGRGCEGAMSPGHVGHKTVSHGWLAAEIGGCAGFNEFTFFKRASAYLLFEFTGGKLSQPLYGWAQIDANFTRNNEPDITLVDWAYDTSGAQIPAGDTGTPEPSTFALTGLAALALGAKGLRVWRAAGKTA